jgi:4-oxalocrotonate tautomerase
MPYVKIEVTREGVTKAQKQRLIQGVTQLLVDVLQKNPKSTHIVISEVDTDNWGVGGEQVTELRKASGTNLK